MSRRGYLDDLRAWVIAAIEEGSSAREASRRSLVSGSSAARWGQSAGAELGVSVPKLTPATVARR